MSHGSNVTCLRIFGGMAWGRLFRRTETLQPLSNHTEGEGKDGEGESGRREGKHLELGSLWEQRLCHKGSEYGQSGDIGL